MEELAIQIIRTLPATVSRVTRDLDDEGSRQRPAPHEWSAVEIVGHLIDKTESWGERMRRIAAEDKPLLPGYDQDEYVRERGYQQQTLATLLPRLQALVEALVADLRGLPPDAWDRQGVHGERGILALGEACRIYADSLPAHVEQLIVARDAALRRV